MFFAIRRFVARISAAWEADEYPAVRDPRRRAAGEARRVLRRRSRLVRAGCALPPLGEADAWDAALLQSATSAHRERSDGAARLRRIPRGRTHPDRMAA